jgi:hypothetical protein
MTKKTTRRRTPKKTAPEAPLFTALRQQRLLNAFGAITPTEQMRVIRLAQELALARSRRLAAQAATRGTGIRNRMQWIGGVR